MDSKGVLKALREMAMIKATKELPEDTKQALLAELRKRIEEATRQGTLSLGAQVTNMKNK